MALGNRETELVGRGRQDEVLRAVIHRLAVICSAWDLVMAEGACSTGQAWVVLRDGARDSRCTLAQFARQVVEDRLRA